MGLFKKKKPKEWQEVCDLDSFTKIREVVVGNKRLALFKLEGDEVRCMDNICSHEFSLLTDGMVLGNDVYCEKHGSRFDIRSGKVQNPPAVSDIKTHEVKVENGKVFVWA